MTDQEMIRAQVTKAVLDVAAAGKLEKGAQIVIGCSTSEIAGGQIGHASVPEIGEWVASAVLNVCTQKGFIPIFQCCEHLNRSLVISLSAAKENRYIRVNAIPYQWQALNDAYTESLNTPADITDAAATDAQIPQDVQTLDNIDAAAADVNDWISEINPNFDPYDLDSAYDNNCGSCAFAVYQRFEGNTDIVASAENIATIEEMNALTGMEQVTMTPEEIQQTLLDQGNGAHAIIGIDRADGPGHWFNAANIDGKVVAIDGQTGEISDWPPDYGDVTNWDMSMKKGH